MRKLILSTPWYKKDQTGHSIGKPGQSHSWETYLQTGIGLGYILSQSEYSILKAAMLIDNVKVVLLRNDKDKRRAEAWLTNLVQTPRQAKGGWRYDVHFKDPKVITPYNYPPIEKVKRNGVKVI